MSKLTLKKKFWVILALLWIGLLVLSILSVRNLYHTTLAERKDGLRNLVDTIETIAQTYVNEVANNKISKEEAQREALKHISEIRYDKDNYFFVFDSRPVVLRVVQCYSHLNKFFNAFFAKAINCRAWLMFSKPA
jgi:methyl-accepting chemotaxis protein